MKTSYSLKEMQLRFNVPQHVLIHLCEKGVIKPDVADPHGRGKVREFSDRNLFEFAVALELRKYEIPISRIGVLIKILDAFEKAASKSINDFKMPLSLKKGPAVAFYLFDGKEAIFSLGKTSLISFQLDKLISGENKKIQLEKIKSLPTKYASYLKLDLSELASKIN